MSKEVLISGKIVVGKKLGTKLGFPTINIRCEKIESGVFVGEIFLQGKWRESVIHVGEKPTIGDVNFSCEVHVLKFDYEMNEEIFPGKDIKVRLLYKIRDTEKFGTLDELKGKISQDVEFAKNWYNLRKL